ncbi:MAG: hypothetical protein IJ958_04640 [Agathobacter sp.]|nr:hypothetical protein [Agathobacter sp.]
MHTRPSITGKDFIICGLAGWCIEVAFTSMGAALRKDKTLTAKTSAWMFPIYGMAAGIGIVAPKISHWPTFYRGLLYGGAIMTGEYITGSLLNKLDACPWSYAGCKFTIKDLVRLDFLPFWMLAGLLYEKLLCNEKETVV